MTKRKSVAVRVLSASESVPKNLGPLALVSPILEQMGIRSSVNQHTAADPRRQIPVGEVIEVLVANRLCSPEPLMHVAQWAHGSGAEFILGTPPSALNDDRLARALDAIFLNRWQILADVALRTAEHFHISLHKLHYDPTSFHFTGEYDEQSPDPALVAELKPFKIEVGRHAQPGDDIKEAQVGVNLANDGKGPLPIFYHSADGSANGHTAVAKNLQHLLKYLKPKRLLTITDRGCFNAEHAVRIVRVHHFDFISSLTWTDELAQLYDGKKLKMKEASFLSFKEKDKRQRNLPEETWERYTLGEIPHKITFTPKPQPPTSDNPKPPKPKPQSIRARLIFVHSTADMQICRKTRQKYTRRITEGLEQIAQSVANGYMKDIAAVHKRVTGLFGKKRAQGYFSYQVAELTQKQITALPPRRRGQRIPALRFSWQYHHQLAEVDATHDGLSAIATSVSKTTNTTDEVFTAFKEQHHIETAHHQWKAPLRLRPLFLKKSTRIESLLLVQFLALMAFYLLQRLYRLAKGDSCRTTAETLLKRFSLCAIGVHEGSRSVSVTPFQLHHSQEAILRTLRFPLVEQQIKRYVSRSTEI